jgi:two-component system CheB/CheR fusion protein
MKPKSSKAGSARLKKLPLAKASSVLPAPIISFRQRDRSFPIIGLGASAGGLEALEEFFKHVPKQSGMAFVVIQHLDPTRKCMMAELLQRSTDMVVEEVSDRTRVFPDHVYVIPPNRDMSVLRGVLHLLEPVASRGVRLPIDFFLRSLAQDRQDQAVGVLLSGMGSDGTLGLRAIKEQGGLCLVQDPASAKYDGMPRSALDAGLADISAPASELPARIIALLKHPPLIASTKLTVEEKTQSAMEKVIILLRVRTGHDFLSYKTSTLYRRIERRMGVHQLHKIGDYVRYLQENEREQDLLFKDLLIGVTSFFRDPDAWDELRKKVLPRLLAGARNGQVLRAWVASCSSGEEAYSLAMVFQEVVSKLKSKDRVTLQIFATDLDKDSIEKARQGFYPENICSDLSVEQLRRFFLKEDSGFRVSPQLRKMIVFAHQNLIMDPPFTRLDILSCRNLLIYLTPEIQKKLVPLFHYSLRPGGVLFLGSAETIGNFGHLFSNLSPKWRLFARKEVADRANPVEFPSTFAPDMPVLVNVLPAVKPAVSLHSLADKLVLDRYAPPAVIANSKGEILYVSGRTGKYLEPAAGKANWNIFVMVRASLRPELTRAFHEALDQSAPVRFESTLIEDAGVKSTVGVVVQRLEEPETLRDLIMVVFTELAPPARGIELRGHGKEGRVSGQSNELVELERKFQQTRLETQIIREEMQSSQEELRSTIEEQQSTNEELTTSKEEMQSLNEELQTVNAELQSKLDELARSNNDMKNLLNSTEVATLFLDNDLKVRRFTVPTAKIIQIIPGDVGRRITDLASDLLYPELAGDCGEVLRVLGFIEKQVCTRDKRWFTIRIMPYRTFDNRIDGVVITFIDITQVKTHERVLLEKQVALERQIASLKKAAAM